MDLGKRVAQSYACAKMLGARAELNGSGQRSSSISAESAFLNDSCHKSRVLSISQQIIGECRFLMEHLMILTILCAASIPLGECPSVHCSYIAMFIVPSKLCYKEKP